MSVDAALEIFGLRVDDLGDQDKIKQRYKKLSLVNHPDHGGDVEIMKSINLAYDVLKKASKSTSSRIDSDEFSKRYYATATGIKTMLMSGFKPELFQVHFKKKFGKDFKYEITNQIPKGSENPKYYYGGAGFTAEFFTEGKDIVFTLTIQTTYNAIHDALRGSKIGTGTLSFDLYTEAFGFFKNKKQKLSKSDWKFTNDHAFLNNPSKLFPDAKLAKIASGSTSKRAFKKRDMLTYIKTKLGGEWDGEFAKIYLDTAKEYRLLMYRMTFDRVPYWGANGIYKKHGRISQGAIVTLPETENTAKLFENIQKTAMKIKDEDRMVKIVNKMLKDGYEDFKKGINKKV